MDVRLNNDHKPSPVLENDGYVDIGRFGQIIWKSKYWIAFCSVLFAAMVALYVQFFVAPTYQAVSTIKLATTQKNIIDFQSIVGGFSGDSMEINTEAEVLRSRSLLRSVVLELDLLNDPEFVSEDDEGFALLEKVKGLLPSGPVIELSEEEQREADIRSVIDTLLKTTSIFNIPQTYVFEIRARSKNPATAVRIADTIAEKYIQSQIEKKFEATEVASAWLSERVSELAVSLEQAESDLAQYSASTNVLSSESVVGLERQLKELRDRRLNIESEIQEKRIYTTALENAMDASREQRAEVAANERLKLLLGDGQESAFDAAYLRLLTRERRELAASEARLDTIETGITRLEEQISQQNEDLIKLSQLQREVESSRLLYEHFLSRLKETSAQQGLQQPDSELLSRSVPPQGAVSPQKKRIVLLTLIFTAFSVSGIILLRDITKKTFSTLQELESFTQNRIWGKIPLMAGRGITPDVIFDLCSKRNSAILTEAFRQLRTSVQFASPLDQPTVIAISSSLPGEGKTTTSLVLAQQLSELGKKVLFVDADMRRSGARQTIGDANTNSLLDAIENPQNIRNACPDQTKLTFDFLSASRPRGNPADILSSQRFSNFVDHAKEIYDYVVIDTPPVLLVPDARVLFMHADVRIVVLRWDQTTRSQLRDTIDLLEKNAPPISGFLINGLRDEEPGNYYGKSYGY